MHDTQRTEGAGQSDRRLSILMIEPAGRGGTVQYAHNLCNALAEAGDRVVLATGIDCEILPYPRRYRLIGVFDRFRQHPGPLWRFVQMVRQMRPDIVHFQGAQQPRFYGLMIWLLRRLGSARFVWTPQDILSNSDRPAHRRLQTANYAQMAHVFVNAAQNETALRDLYRVPGDRVTVLEIPDLVAFARTDLARTAPPELVPPPQGPVVLCFGLIEPRKGIATLVSAFGRMAARHPDATLLIFGKALTDISPYTEAARALGLPGGRIRIIARYASFAEMNWLFEAASVVVLPYVSGWNSGVLAAAFGFGKPVVATRVGGFDEVICDGVNGLLVAPEDPEALAAAIGEILLDGALRERLGKAAADWMRARSWTEVATEVRRVYAAMTEDAVAGG